MRDGDEYVINGQKKTWTTLGQFADWIFVLARTNPPDAPPKKQAGISFILVEMNTPGITLRPIKLIDGSYEVNEVFFEDVRVPANQLVGEENQAGPTPSSCCPTSAPASPHRHHQAVARRRQGERRADQGRHGEPARGPAVRRQGRRDRKKRAAGTGTHAAAGQRRRGTGKPNPASSILKLRGSQLQQAVTELAVEVAGPDALPFDGGADIDSPLWAQHAAPKYLNYRKTSIYGGSNEVQRTIISSTILGL